MFQDIAPHRLRNEFCTKAPSETDYVAFYKSNALLMENSGGATVLPTYSTALKEFPEAIGDLVYLFSVDEDAYYLSMAPVAETERFSYAAMMTFRELQPAHLAFACATAVHLAAWYDCHRYCGRCGAMTEHKRDERAIVCPACGLVEYPKIAPVVIVGITNGNKLLLTKYAAGYARHALVAGFAEIGETLEEAVRREVMEEVGLKVSSIHYYKSQPWAFSGSLLAGFFAELDGSDAVTLDQNELAEAQWFDRAEIPHDGNTMSLTWTMVEAFRDGEV